MNTPFQWLYKLHGLGVEYECEICSGAKCAFSQGYSHNHF